MPTRPMVGGDVESECKQFFPGKRKVFTDKTVADCKSSSKMGWCGDNPTAKKAVPIKRDLMSEFSTPSRWTVGLGGLKDVNRGICIVEDVLVFSKK